MSRDKTPLRIIERTLRDWKPKTPREEKLLSHLLTAKHEIEFLTDTCNKLWDQNSILNALIQDWHNVQARLNQMKLVKPVSGSW